MKKILILVIFLFFVWFIYNLNLINWDKFSNIKSNTGSVISKNNDLNNLELNINIIEDVLGYYIDEETENAKIMKEKHISTPKNVKSLYFSANAINNEKKLNNFFKIIKEKEINSIMIDIKEVDWYINFTLDDSYFWNIKPVSNNKIKNIDELIKKLHDENIYIIARIAVFKDKRLAEDRKDLALKWISNWKVWEDYKWYKYVDQYSKDVWNYNAELWIAAYDLGFDEINYDYIRFPTDWYISQIYYPFASEIINSDKKWWKVKVIDMFSNYITSKLKKYNSDIIISADVFWLVTDYTMFGIGQNLESFLLSFDYIWPMIYPSHYWEGYYGYKYPDNNPYWIISIALKNASEKINNLNIEIKNANIEFRDIKLNDNFTYSKRDLSDKKINIKQIRPFLQWFSCTWCRNYTLYDRNKFREAVKWVNSIWIDSWWVRSSGWYYREVRFNEKITEKNEKM